MTVQVTALYVGGPVDGQVTTLPSDAARVLIPVPDPDGGFGTFSYVMIRTPGGTYILVPESERLH